MKLIMCKGLPGSGKTRWALAEIDHITNNNQSSILPHLPEVIRVNKDDIRRELEATGWVWSRDNEKYVIRERNKRIADALSREYSVISDDANFAPKHEQTLRAIATQFGVTFEIKDFTAVSIETCIDQDNKRVGKARVGEKIIRDMARQYGLLTKPLVKKYVPNAIICDLDGTLALSNGLRGPYEHEKCANDVVNIPILKIIRKFYSTWYDILYVSGRDSKFREQTLLFLDKYRCPPGPLFMRATGDKRNDAIVKLELYHNNIKDKYDVLFTLDDRDRVVKMWRELGLTCLQVAPGDF